MVRGCKGEGGEGSSTEERRKKIDGRNKEENLEKDRKIDKRTARNEVTDDGKTERKNINCHGWGKSLEHRRT